MDLATPLSPTLLSSLQQRRQRLAAQVAEPVILWSGGESPRNFAANTYPYRASSHFLYLAGLPIPDAALRFHAGKVQLFKNDPDPRGELWHGPQPRAADLAALIQVDEALPLTELPRYASGALTIPVQDPITRQHQADSLGRSVGLSTAPAALDQILVDAVIQLRLQQDKGALEEMRRAAATTVKAHRAGMATTALASREADVRAAMERIMISATMSPAYNSIVTIQGEVLHNEVYHHDLKPGDLLLADVGAESPLGWASDVTRTWPVSGQFSSTQRDLYEIVLAAHDACIAAAKPGIEYRDLHLLAARVMTEGLVELGILKGDPQDLVDRDAHALFFPHGVGHLLGLDVHDMEDLGDRAGYAPGRQRSSRFGLGYLRLDRLLQVGMVVTIEPGFYQVPAILQDPDRQKQFQDCVNWKRLQQFGDVRGIRIEDDVLITESGCEVLTAALPTQISEIEACVQGDG